jgi:hypothetical protein
VLKTKGVGLRVTSCGFRVASFGLRVTSYRLRVTSYGVRGPGCGSWLRFEKLGVIGFVFLWCAGALPLVSLC